MPHDVPLVFIRVTDHDLEWRGEVIEELVQMNVRVSDIFNEVLCGYDSQRLAAKDRATYILHVITGDESLDGVLAGNMVINVINDLIYAPTRTVVVFDTARMSESFKRFFQSFEVQIRADNPDAHIFNDRRAALVWMAVNL